MASLHARHSRTCPPEGKWTSPDASGCTCTPTYYVVSRDRELHAFRVTAKRVAPNAMRCTKQENARGRKSIDEPLVWSVDLRHPTQGFGGTDCPLWVDEVFPSELKHRLREDVANGRLFVV